MVYGIRQSRNGESGFKRFTGDAFYGLMEMLGTKVIKNHADYRLLGSKALQALSKYEESNLFLRGIIPSIGFQSTTLEYEEKPRLAGESKYSLRKMIQLVAPIWLLGGIQLLALGIVGEYIGKIYLETKHRPRYEIEAMIINQNGDKE